MKPAKKMIEGKLATISPSDSLQAADFCMKTFSYLHLPVLENQQLVGIVSNRDVTRGLTLQAAAKREFYVREIMSTPVVTVDRQSTLNEATNLMLQHKISSLVVMDGESVASIITETDILNAFQRLMMNRDKTVNSAMEWNGLDGLDLLQTLSFLQYR